MKCLQSVGGWESSKELGHKDAGRERSADQTGKETVVLSRRTQGILGAWQGERGDKDPALTLLLPSHRLLGPRSHGPSSRGDLEGQLRRPTLPASLDLFLHQLAQEGHRGFGKYILLRASRSY